MKSDLDGVDYDGVSISIVVPVYNAAKYLQPCIQALLTQNYPRDSYEIIMIDNNSTDDSVPIIKNHSRIKLLSEQRQGAYAARNRGVVASKGKIIAFTDPDCVAANDWLTQIHKAMSHPGVQIVLGSHLLATESPLLRILEAYENEKNRYVFGTGKKLLYFGHTNNMAVRKALFDEMGPFLQLERGSDTVLVRRCVDAHTCESVVYFPQIQVTHLEVDSARKYFKKVFTYGRSLQTYGNIANATSMTNRERIRVFRNTVQHYSWIRSALLFSVLSTGWVYWICGCVGAASKQRKRVRL